MKKGFACMVAVAAALSLGACGGGSGGETTQPGTTDTPAQQEQTAPANSLEAFIQDVQADFSSTSKKLLDEQEKLFAEVGETYEDYLASVDKIQQWYDLAVSETEALGGRAVERGREYYKLVVDSVDVTDDRELDKATEEYYDSVYEDAFEDYYDEIYEDAFDEMYDAYYDGVIQDAYDVTPYDEWSDAHGDAYDAWSDARGDVYDAWSDARSDVYSDYSDVRSAFYSNDFDVEGIFAPVQVVENGGANESAEPEAGDTVPAAAGESDASGVDPDFKAMMDGYESFFNEYVEFIKAYGENPTSTDLIGQYSNLMAQYTKSMNSMSEMDTSDLSPADAAYYAEVTARIYEKLAEVA